MATTVHLQNRAWQPVCGATGAVARVVELITCPKCSNELKQLEATDKVTVEMGSVYWPLKK